MTTGNSSSGSGGSSLSAVKIKAIRLFHEKKYVDALASFLSALHIASQQGDAAEIAKCTSNIRHCKMRLGVNCGSGSDSD